MALSCFKDPHHVAYALHTVNDEVGRFRWKVNWVLRFRWVQAECLNEQLGPAQKRHDAAEAAATPEERVIMNVAKRKQAQQLQKQEVGLSLQYQNTFICFQ